MRDVINFNNNWTFIGKDGVEMVVDVPHIRNGTDGQDGGNDNYRSIFQYRKSFPGPDFDPVFQRVYLEFYGINASAEVTLNGKVIMARDDGRTTFRADVTDYLEMENCLEVSADYSDNDRVDSRKADIAFHGGIYRDVLLVVVPKNHFDMDHWGSNGLKITPRVEGRDGKVKVETFHKVEDAKVAVRLLDADCKVVASGEGTDITLIVPNVRLWDSVKAPCLHVCEADLIVDGRVVDQVASIFSV